MIDKDEFLALLKKHAGSDHASMEDILFGSGIDMSSIGFTEFILELEELHDVDIDLDRLDGSVRTVGQLHKRLETILAEG
jgi:acyl carrier protein